MSRSNNIEIKNPSEIFMQWSGDNGNFNYWDKSKTSEKDGKTIEGARVSVPLPFTFLVLDTLSTIKGFSDADQCPYFANEIRDLKKEILVVRNKNGEQEKGYYKDISNSKNIVGARYCQSVYIAYKEEGKLKIGNISMVGAALGVWIEFRKKNKIYEGTVVVRESKEEKKGKNVFQVPVFEMGEVSKETDEEVKVLDKELQKYLFAYFQRSRTEQVVQNPAEVVVEKTVEEPGNSSTNDTPDDLPF